MPRRRLTQRGLFARTAAPDSMSGHNPNVPIRLYDTHPNSRFAVGDEVTYLDSMWLKVRGTVLGHVAEDRLLVQWPNKVAQEDVEDVVGSRELIRREGRRKANEIVIERDPDPDDEDELEYIPDKPNFRDGDPVDDEHPGELPSEQDPRDKIEEVSDQDDECGCDAFELLVELPDVNDVTDWIEDHLTASRRKALFGRVGQEQSATSETWKDIEDPQTGKQRYTHGGIAALDYNAFYDGEVVEVLRRHGFHDDDIRTFGEIRKHQLEAAKKKAYAKKPAGFKGIRTDLPDYEWGQSSGIRYTVKSPTSKGQTQTKKPQSKAQIADWVKKTEAQGNLSEEDKQGVQFAKQWLDKPDPNTADALNQWASKRRQRQQQTAAPGTAAPAGAGNEKPKPTKEQQLAKNRYGYVDDQGIWQRWDASTKTYKPSHAKYKWDETIGDWGFVGYQYPAQGTPVPSASRQINRLRNRAEFVKESLAMPRTAKIIRQAANVAEAAREIDTGGDLDETTKRAVRFATQDFLLAMTHLRGSNNRMANMVAPQIEQAFVDALSN